MTTLLLWMTAGVTPVPVTVPVMVRVGRVEPGAKGVLALVQVIFCPTGAAQTQPLPYPPVGVTPAGRVSVTETGAVSGAPDCTPARTT